MEWADTQRTLLQIDARGKVASLRNPDFWRGEVERGFASVVILSMASNAEKIREAYENAGVPEEVF